MSRMLFKRTTPFEAQCCFAHDDGQGLWERCEAKADVGLYYGDKEMVKGVSLCLFHCIYQESIWIGENE